MATTFDEAELMERVDHDMGFLAETVEILTSDAPGMLEELRGALAAGDATAVGRLAHTLKGMISNFCAPPAQAAALEVEKIGKGGDLATAPGAVLALEGHLGALTAELLEYVKARA